MIPIYWALVVANAVGFGTVFGGWWMLPIVCVLAAALAPSRAMAWFSIPLGALVGWGTLLLRSSQSPAFPALRAMLSDVLPIPPSQLAAITLVFPLLLGLGAALLMAGLRRTPRADPVDVSHPKEN